MTYHSVLIACGGPTGLMLAGELALAGVDVAVVERRPSQELSGARARRACDERRCVCPEHKELGKLSGSSWTRRNSVSRSIARNPLVCSCTSMF